MKTVQVLILLFVLCGIVVVGAQITLRFLRKSPTPVAKGPSPRDSKNRISNNQNQLGQSKPTNTAAAKPDIAPTPKSQVGQIRMAEDAAHKKGDFWLEQEFELIGETKRDSKKFVKLYAGLDDKTLRGISVTVSGWEAVLELEEGKDGAKRELAKAKLPQFPAGRYDLGVLWRNGELSVWIGPVEVLEYCPPDKAALVERLKMDSAVQVLSEDVGLGARRAISFNTIRFDDNFMRSAGNDDWRPLAGRWELTAMAFAERSANPFSLRCSFGVNTPFEDPIYGGERRTRGEDYGLGVQLSASEGTPHIVRMTGGSPASHAGLAEDDIFIEVNGRSVGMSDIGNLYRQIFNAPGDLRLKMYRPGERMFREYNITREQYKWGVSVEGQPIAPISAPAIRGGDEFAMISAGEAGWSDYEIEVAAKPLGGGGFGLAVAALSDKDFVLFRWRGPHARGSTNTGKTNVLQLVRVKNGQENVLAEKPARYRPYEFYRMGVNWSGDKVKCLIDKNEIFSASIGDIKRGKIGLYGLKGDPVFFDDLHVAGDRAITSAWHVAERSFNSIFALEDDMEVWANPALEWERDVKSPWSIHKQRFPGEQAISIAKPRFKELEIALYSGAEPESPTCPRLTIRDGVAELSGDGLMKQKLSVGAGPFQHVGFESGVFGARATIDGKKMASEWDGAKPHFGMPGARLSGERVAVRGLKNLGDPSAVRVTSTGTMEYTFDNAPSDWKVLSGRWGLLNKWICDPRWSWFGGRTKTAGAIWNKHVFSGDISVDAHVAMLMVRDDPPFERTGDHNITICGDGFNPDSGYTLIFGGDINSWTRLYRKGVMVAEATKEDFRVFSDRIRHPDKPDLHQRWFHLKLEKIGNVISFYRDGKQAFTFTDPEPLKEGRVGFWTLDNSFLLSRVRIAHGGAHPAPFEDGRAELLEDAKAVNMYDAETPTAAVREQLPDEIIASLGSAPSAFQAAVSDALPVANPPLAQEQADNAAGLRGFRVTNAVGGGPFALQFRARTIDIERDGVVRFAYRIEPDAKIDFYLVGVRDGDFNPRHQNCYRWRLNGPKEDNSGTLSDEFAPLVGEVPGVVADGKWHTVQFDLQPSWRDFWRRRGYAHAVRFPLRPMFGNLCNVGYLLGGMNGNHAGTSYSATEVKAMTPAEASTLPPSVARVVWPFDAQGDGRSVAIYFDSPGSGVAAETLRVSLNGAMLPTELVQNDGPVSFNSTEQCLRINLLKMKESGAAMLAALKDGDKLALKIEPNFSDRGGHANTPGFNAEWTFSAEAALKANKAVNAPLIMFHRGQGMELKPGDAALKLTDVSSVDMAGTRIQASQDAPPWAPAGQARSVEVIAMAELPAMGFSLRGARYDLQSWPYVDLEYKVPQDAPFNLHMTDEQGNTHALLLVDVFDGRDNQSGEIVSRFGPPEDFVADGKWRRSTVPLLKLISDAGQGGRQITSFNFHDNGWRGGRRGIHYWIHRLQPVPAGRAEELTISFTASDLAGIAEMETSVDDSPAGDPSGKHELTPAKTLAQSLAASGKKLKDGWNYVHVRAKNSAGVWSEAAHRKFFLDTTAPRISKTEPADGGKLESQTVRIYLQEEHGVNGDALEVKVDGTSVRQFLEYDEKTGVLKYNALNAGQRFTPGTKSKVEITGLADRFGNVQTQPYEFSFECDARAGKPGPELLALTYAASTERGASYRQYEMELSFGLNFEDYLGHVHALRDCKVDWLNDAALASDGKRAAKFICLQDDGDVKIMLHKNAWFIDRLPILNFDYKADPGFKVDLHIEAFGVWHSVRFTGTGHAPNEGKALGAIPAIVPDGTWRHASIDMRAVLDAARVRMPERIVNKIVFSANGEDGCVRGATLAIDNLDLTPANGGAWRGGYGGMIKWKAKSNPAEIAGYSVVIDHDPTTIPPEKINQREQTMSMPPRSGVWYAHVRACDQAGNWGPDKTIRMDFGQNNARQRVFDDEN